ncbi:MAG: NAD(+) synthase [Thermoleophilia bacterium]
MDALITHLSAWIRSEVEAGGGAGAVYGLSGGIDSAVVAALARLAFPHHTLGVVMPCHSDPQDAEDGALVAHHYGVPFTTVDLGPAYDTLLEALSESCTDLPASRLATANLKPRLRMTTLYALANQLGYRVLGTGNRSEIAIGYFTKYGDGGADLLPLGSLVKSEVRELARALGLPPRIIDKPPSAGLWASQTDEAEMGLTYDELDSYLLTGTAAPAVKTRVDAMHTASEHKRTLPRIAPKPGA